MTLSLKNPAGNPTSSIGINRTSKKIQTRTENILLKSDKGMDDTANYSRNPTTSIPFTDAKSSGGYGWYCNFYRKSRTFHNAKWKNPTGNPIPSIGGYRYWQKMEWPNLHKSHHQKAQKSRFNMAILTFIQWLGPWNSYQSNPSHQTFHP